MKPTYKKLIKALLESSTSIKANNLASILEVSVRSVKNYIHDINILYDNCISSSRDGYTIDRTKAEALLDESDTIVPQTSDERIVYIINSIIRSHSDEETVNAFDLCDELCVSMSTLKNELTKIKRIIQDYDLKLENNAEDLTIVGLEKNKRKLLSTMLYNESNVNFVNLKAIQTAFPDIDINFIKSCVIETLNEYHYFINDYSLINLVLHLTIAIDRIRNNNYNNQNVDKLPAVRIHEFELSEKVANKLEEHFNIKYTEAEKYEITLLLVSRATTVDYASITTANLEEFIGKDCLDLVKELIADIANFYYIDLTEPEFFIRFALHIRNLLVRSKNNSFSKNPLTEGIKTSCPMIYDDSVLMASIIKKRTGITINDDEIAYIAFHLGSTLEAQKGLSSKITAVLYCPDYYDMKTKLTETINRNFESDILIKHILTDESEFDKINEYNLVFSTIPISRVLNVPIIYLNLFLTDKNIYTIKHTVEEIKLNKKKEQFEKHLRSLIIPDLFEIKNDLKTEKEAIPYMVRKFKKLDYVDNNYINEIMERENMSSTAFNGFAIPHAMRMHAKKTGINVLISNNPILWNGKGVQLIIMLCFEINDRHIFNELFDPLTMILSDSDNIKKVIQSTDYESFITTIVSLLKPEY